MQEAEIFACTVQTLCVDCWKQNGCLHSGLGIRFFWCNCKCEGEMKN